MAASWRCCTAGGRGRTGGLFLRHPSVSSLITWRRLDRRFGLSVMSKTEYRQPMRLLTLVLCDRGCDRLAPRLLPAGFLVFPELFAVPETRTPPLPSRHRQRTTHRTDLR